MTAEEEEEDKPSELSGQEARSDGEVEILDTYHAIGKHWRHGTNLPLDDDDDNYGEEGVIPLRTA